VEGKSGRTSYAWNVEQRTWNRSVASQRKQARELAAERPCWFHVTEDRTSKMHTASRDTVGHQFLNAQTLMERLCAACARQAAAGCTCGVSPRRPMITRKAAGARALACIWLALLVAQVGCQGSTGSSAGSGTGTGGTTGATGTAGTAGYDTGGGETGAAGTAGPSAPASMDPLVKVAAAACAERGPEYIFNVAALACARCPLNQVPSVDGNECVCPPTSRSAGLAGPLVCEDCSSKNLAVSIDGMSCMACAGRVRPWIFQTLLAFFVVPCSTKGAWVGQGYPYAPLHRAERAYARSAGVTPAEMSAWHPFTHMLAWGFLVFMGHAGR
jgi:hypothetical protein